MPNQMMGVISTPPIGGISLRVTASNGSVGQYSKIQGKRPNSTWGYQVKTIRKTNKTLMTPKSGPKVQISTVGVSMKSDAVTADSSLSGLARIV